MALRSSFCNSFFKFAINVSVKRKKKKITEFDLTVLCKFFVLLELEQSSPLNDHFTLFLKTGD